MAITPKKGHHTFNNGLLSLLRDRINKSIMENLKPAGKNNIPEKVQELMKNPIGNPNLEKYWEQHMTVHFKKETECANQVRFGWLITQLKENIYGCMVALWYGYVHPGVVHYKKLIKQYVTEMITDKLYIDEEAVLVWTGSSKKLQEVGTAARTFLESIVYLNNADKNTIIPDIVNAFRKVN